MKDSDLPPLSAEEEKAAILEARRKKYHRLKHSDYWADQEAPIKPKYVKEVKIKVKSLIIDRSLPKIHIDEV